MTFEVEEIISPRRLVTRIADKTLPFGGKWVIEMDVHLENLRTAFKVGPTNADLAVEAAWAHERIVEDIGAVRGGHEYHALVGRETVHFHEELVERVLALIVAALHGTTPTGASDGIYFINKNDAGGFFAGLPEEVAHTARAYADEHFYEVRT